MFRIQTLAVLGFVLGAAASAAAQWGPAQEGIPETQIAIDYSYMRANAAPGNCGCFGLNGGNVEVAVQTYRNFSSVVDIGGENAGATSVPGQSLTLLSYTAGPRYSYPLPRIGRLRMIPFAQGLVGVMHGSADAFPNQSGSLSNSATDLGVLVGGGLDIALSGRFAIRAAQVDYGLSKLPNNADNSQNLLRVSTGVVLRLR